MKERLKVLLDLKKKGLDWPAQCITVVRVMHRKMFFYFSPIKGKCIKCSPSHLSNNFPLVMNLLNMYSSGSLILYIKIRLYYLFICKSLAMS